VALAPVSGMTTAVCAALGVSRASVQRRRCRLAAPPTIARQRPKPIRALSGPQQQAMLDLLHAPRFADQAPAEIYASLLDEGVYHCSIRTMYRILDQHGEVRERREQLRHPVYRKPELLAERPNQVWPWDITKLMGPTKWSYFYIYVIFDIFSRRVVGWCVADAESAALFRQFRPLRVIGPPRSRHEFSRLFNYLAMGTVTGAKVWAGAHFSLAPIRRRGFFGPCAAVTLPFRVMPFRA